MSGHHEGLAWFNFAFLLSITLMPFTSDLLGQHGDNPLAVDIFGLNLLLASATSTATMAYAQRRGLLSSDSDEPTIRAGRIRSASASAAVVIAMAVAWVDTTAAAYCWFLIAVFPLVARRLWDVQPAES
jgi:uncharacterized membrane protein